MPTPVTETTEGGQHVEWSETFHAFLFRAGIYLKRFWWILIITVAAGVLMQKWKLRDAKPSYISTGEMTPSVQVFANTGTSAGASEIVSNYWGQQKHILESSRLYSAAYDKAVASSSKYENYKPSVTASADLIPNTNVLSLKAVGSDKDFTQTFLDAWMEAFLRERKEMRDQSMKSLDLSLTGEALQYQDDEKRQNDALSAYLQTKQIASVEAAVAAAADVEKKLRDAAYAVYSYKNQLLPLGRQSPAPAVARPGAEIPPGAGLPAGSSPAAAAGADPYLMDEEKFNLYVGDNNNLQGRDTDVIDQELLSHGLLLPDGDYENMKKERLALQAKYEQLKGGLGETHPKLEDYMLKIVAMDSALQEHRRQRVAALEHVRVGIISELELSEDAEKQFERENNDYLDIMKNINSFKLQITNDHDRYNGLLQGSKSLEESLHLV